MSAPAARAYAQAERPLARKLARCFQELEGDPLRSNNVKALAGPYRGMYRYRLGDHRVIFRIDQANEVVEIVSIAHRSDAYD